MRNLNNDEHNDLYHSPNIVRVIKSRRMTWVGHVARRGRGEAYTGFWRGNLRERDHLGDPGVDGRIIFKMDVQEVGCGGIDWMVAGTCECGIEPSGSIKCGEFLD